MPWIGEEGCAIPTSRPDQMERLIVDFNAISRHSGAREIVVLVRAGRVSRRQSKGDCGSKPIASSQTRDQSAISGIFRN